MGQFMLNKSFIGSWGQESFENIPHEIINLFRSDNGNIYIYVPPYGGYSTKDHDAVDCIFLTGSWNQNMTEILYVLKGLTPLHEGGKKATPKDRAQLVEKIKRENIRYGGKYLHEIQMASNEEAFIFYMTFQAQTMLKPRRKMFFSWAPGTESHDEQRDIFEFPSEYKYQRLFGFLPEGDSSIAAGIAAEEALWEAATMKAVDPAAAAPAGSSGFMKLIGKEYDETAYTNLFYGFFNACPSLFTKFAQEVLQIPTAGQFTVRKEVTTQDKKGRLDLLAESPDAVIAIENKLQSGLNGIDKHGQLSQLTTYIRFVEDNILKGRTGYYFLFEPNYNDIDIARFDAQRGSEWVKCRYSSIYQFMLRNKAMLVSSPLDRFADEFIDALYLHTLQLKDIAQQRFLDAIYGK